MISSRESQLYLQRLFRKKVIVTGSAWTQLLGSHYSPTNVPFLAGLAVQCPNFAAGGATMSVPPRSAQSPAAAHMTEPFFPGDAGHELRV